MPIMSSLSSFPSLPFPLHSQQSVVDISTFCSPLAYTHMCTLSSPLPSPGPLSSLPLLFPRLPHYSSHYSRTHSPCTCPAPCMKCCESGASCIMHQRFKASSSSIGSRLRSTSASIYRLIADPIGLVELAVHTPRPSTSTTTSPSIDLLP